MKTFCRVRMVSAIGALLFFGLPATATLTFDWVIVGNAGNTPDPLTGRGAVNDAHRIAKHEVTNAQYAEFLNSVAATDTFALYNTGMASNYGGITRSGAPGGYTYATVAGRENNPVVTAQP